VALLEVEMESAAAYTAALNLPAPALLLPRELAVLPLAGLLWVAVPLIARGWHCLQEVLEPALGWLQEGSSVASRLARIWAGRTCGSQLP